MWISFEAICIERTAMIPAHGEKWEDFINRMRDDHQELVEYLAAAKAEINNARSIPFRSVLKEFGAKLAQHRKLETEAPYLAISGDLNSDWIQHMIEPSMDRFIR